MVTHTNAPIYVLIGSTELWDSMFMYALVSDPLRFSKL